MEFSISLEGSETLASMARMLGQSPADLMADALRNALSDFVEEYPGVIADYEITVVDSETDDLDKPRGRTGLTTREIARDVRQTTVTRAPRQSVTPSDSDDSGEPVKRQGRPPLKKEADGTRWEASDGGTVTEYGNRSVQSLKDEGIACRKVGASAWPKWFERQQENDAEPVKPTRSASAPTPNMRVRIPRTK